MSISTEKLHKLATKNDLKKLEAKLGQIEAKMNLILGAINMVTKEKKKKKWFFN